MDTYTTGRSRTGHYRKPGSHLTYCGRHALTRTSTHTRMCRPCVKAEALDRAAATATAEAWLDQPPATPLAAALMFGALVEAVDNRRAAEERAARASADRYIAREFPPVAALLDIDAEAAEIEARAATEGRTSTPAAAGTWRAQWIGTRATSPTPTLFDVEPDTEQGALFA
ncbi:hypothetical protein [Streptomyces sp. NBC_00199]|uniref:hypothetical protein n=1 Tax=Streptomyces sp. NBC_00199 TaxID=2975678 RepID=UPI002254FA56|nr:hypothetical protein [Streptomyces sp. NBC_00199]MCX5266070.1 hypothetical protein [Streptomyces sp. NBC_00199]